MKNNEEYTYAMHTLSILEKRKSCRYYTEGLISQEELEAILMAGNAAPIGMNRIRDIKIFVIQNPSLLMELEENTQLIYARMGLKMDGIYNAPTLIIVTVKKLEGAFQKAQYCSAACIIENMLIAATEMELGNIFLTGVATALNENEVLLRKIGIPEDYEAVGAMAVGKTEEEETKRQLSPLRIAVERR